MTDLNVLKENLARLADNKGGYDPALARNTAKQAIVAIDFLTQSLAEAVVLVSKSEQLLCEGKQIVLEQSEKIKQLQDGV